MGFRSLTVAHVRDLLEGYDDDQLVVFTADYGDYSHTPQALPLRGEAQEREIEESGYSQSGWALVPQERERMIVEADEAEDGRCACGAEEGDWHKEGCAVWAAKPARLTVLVLS